MFRSTWIYSIARNACIRVTQRRRKSTFSSFNQLIEQLFDPLAAGAFTGDELRDLSAQVKEGWFPGLIRCLPKNQYLALITHVFLHIPI